MGAKHGEQVMAGTRQAAGLTVMVQPVAILRLRFLYTTCKRLLLFLLSSIIIQIQDIDAEHLKRHKI